MTTVLIIFGLIMLLLLLLIGGNLCGNFSNRSDRGYSKKGSRINENI